MTKEQERKMVSLAQVWPEERDELKQTAEKLSKKNKSFKPVSIRELILTMHKQYKETL